MTDESNPVRLELDLFGVSQVLPQIVDGVVDLPSRLAGPDGARAACCTASTSSSAWRI